MMRTLHLDGPREFHYLRVTREGADDIFYKGRRFIVRSLDYGFEVGHLIQFNARDEDGLSHPIDDELFVVTHAFELPDMQPAFGVYGIERLEEARILGR